MLAMVIAKPILLTIVSAVPWILSGAFWAIRVENIGESDTTVMPHITMKPMKMEVEGMAYMNGKSTQHIPDINKEV